MNYSKIDPFSIANGPGVRVSLFVSGCRVGCKGCFNADARDFAAGRPFDSDAQRKVIDAVANPWCSGLTLLGGEPFEPENQAGLAPFLNVVRASLRNGQTIWAYSGNVFDRLPVTEHLGDMLSNVDVLVDGPFVESLKDVSLAYRGSSNQRLIDVPATFAAGRVVEIDAATRGSI